MTKKTVGICDTQPVTVAGLRHMLETSPELEFTQAADSLAAAAYLVKVHAPAVLILDKGFGVQALLEWLTELKQSRVPTAPVIWGISISESEALRFLQAGARGIVRKTADPNTLLACLRMVAGGATWMEDTVFHNGRGERGHRSDLTVREQQVLELVEQGLKNKEIAHQLGIRPGTVKIHLKHIFEKTGVRGRYGLALSGFQQRVDLGQAMPDLEPDEGDTDHTPFITHADHLAPRLAPVNGL
jgi:DNA-binding NarL/FixJ family response regulator